MSSKVRAKTWLYLASGRIITLASNVGENARFHVFVANL
jgi:hypothetical protein